MEKEVRQHLQRRRLYEEIGNAGLVCRRCGISRPTKPASPHLNGKVERSQKTDKVEFYKTIDISPARLDMLLAEWQQYLTERGHTVLTMGKHL